jgi:hypothetical protein
VCAENLTTIDNIVFIGKHAMHFKPNLQVGYLKIIPIQGKI